MNCYIDESVHRHLGFVASAFVFSTYDMDTAVAAILRKAWFHPETHEFKSGARMDGNPARQDVRDGIFQLIRERSRLAVVFSPIDARAPLGKLCLQGLQSVLVRNGLPPTGLHVFFDGGIFSSATEASLLWSLYTFLRPARLHPREDSRRCRGIQAADLAAHTFSQVLRDELLPERRRIVFEPDYPGGEPESMTLSMILLSQIRYAILRRGMVMGGEAYDPATDPVVLSPEDDPVEYGVEPEVYGWGVQVAPEASEQLRRAVRNSLDRIWLGCMH